MGRVNRPSVRPGAGWYLFENESRSDLGINPAQRRLIAPAGFRGEVANGGIDQFFFNSAGLLGPEVAGIARETGQVELLRIISEALAMLGTPYPVIHDSCIDGLAHLGDNAFDELTNAYLELEDGTDLDEVMDEYVWDHERDFFIE